MLLTSKPLLIALETRNFDEGTTFEIITYPENLAFLCVIGVKYQRVIKNPFLDGCVVQNAVGGRGFTLAGTGG